MKTLTPALLLALLPGPALAATPSMEEMWAIIQQQQAEISQLKEQLAEADTQLHQTNIRVDATADLVEERILPGAGPALASNWTERTHIGGYAEMHYNNLEDGNDSQKKELDFHRFVFFLGHEFSEKTRFFSEVELEHSLVSNSSGGEVELEQAYIEHDLGDSLRMKAGLFLIPVGILNETHEPDTFYGTERNDVEKNIIPTTWWEGGLALTGEIVPGLSFDATYTSGLGLSAADGEWKIRDGRQKVAQALASDPAYTARLKYNGMAGLELAATLQYQQDIYQGTADTDIDAMLYEAHLNYRSGGFGLRALAAAWDIDDAIEQFEEGANRQEGWYVEPSWRFAGKTGIFARYAQWDNQADGGGDTEYNQWNLGVNYWLEETVVFKFDYQLQDAPDGKSQLDGFNLGVGWSF